LALGWIVVALLLGDRDAVSKLGALAPEEPPTEATRDSGAPSLEGETSTGVASGRDRVASQARAGLEAEAERAVQSSAPTMGTGVLLFGVVTDQDDHPLEDVGIGRLDAEGRWDLVSSDAEGRYSYGPLDPADENPVTLVTWQMEHFRVERKVDLPVDQDALRVDFQLRTKRVIWVREEFGSMPEPQPFLVPVATAEDPGETFEGISGSLNNQFGIGTFWSNGQQKFERDDPAWVGTVTLEEDGPAWISLIKEGQVVAKQELDPHATEVRFDIDPAILETLHAELRALLVADEDGLPLAGTASLVGEPFMFRRGTPVESDGVLLLSDARLGKSWLIVHVEGRAELKRRVDLGRGELLDLGELRLKEPVAISGFVLGEDAKPLEAVLRWGRYDSEGRFAWVRQQVARSRTDGSFHVGGLEPDLWYVQVLGGIAASPRPFEPSVRSLPLVVDARAGDVEDVELRVSKTVAVTVLLSVEKPWPKLWVRTPDGLLETGMQLGWSGDKSVLHLLGGDYTFELEREGEAPVSRDVSVGSEALTIEL
jgi:hypothetical protein